jgi:hypothetical protein
MIRAAVPAVTDDEIEIVIEQKIKPKCWTGNLAGYLAQWSESDIAAKVAEVRTDRKRAKRQADKAEVARFRTLASKQPECEHGQPGGDLIGPDGIAPCPFCRNQLDASDRRRTHASGIPSTTGDPL